MFRIVIKRDVVGIPLPIAAVRHIVWCDAEESAGKSEVVSLPSFQAVYMTCSDFSGETPMLPRTIETVMCVIAAGIVADPLIVIGVDMRRFRMFGLIAKSSAWLLLWFLALWGWNRCA
jgi:hypothetical protein